jgi:hypothetical protein
MEMAFHGTVVRTEPLNEVRVDGVADEEPYGTAYLHNVLANPEFTPGARISVRGLIVEHGYGTLFIWNYHWKRLRERFDD